MQQKSPAEGKFRHQLISSPSKKKKAEGVLHDRDGITRHTHIHLVVNHEKVWLPFERFNNVWCGRGDIGFELHLA